MDHQYQEILLKLQQLEFQVGRLVSDAESEKEFRKQRNIEIEKRLRDIEQWKSEVHGKVIATLAIGGLVWGVIVAVVLKFLG